MSGVLGVSLKEAQETLQLGTKKKFVQKLKLLTGVGLGFRIFQNEQELYEHGV